MHAIIFGGCQNANHGSPFVTDAKGGLVAQLARVQSAGQQIVGKNMIHRIAISLFLGLLPGNFGGGGATGSYEQSDCERNGHDWGEWRYNEWSKPYPHKPDCEVRTKSRSCKSCGTDNTQQEKRGKC